MGEIARGKRRRHQRGGIRGKASKEAVEAGEQSDTTDDEVGLAHLQELADPDEWHEEFLLPCSREAVQFAEASIVEPSTTKAVEVWAKCNGLVSPEDFVFAFVDAQEVQQKLGLVAMQVWQRLFDSAFRKTAAKAWGVAMKLLDETTKAVKEEIAESRSPPEKKSWA